MKFIAFVPYAAFITVIRESHDEVRASALSIYGNTVGALGLQEFAPTSLAPVVNQIFRGSMMINDASRFAGKK